MPFQVSPGVNVSEIDLTTVVPAVSTTEGAIAGVFRWGPVGERVLIDSESNLVNRFGKPTSHNAETFFTAANFLSYGNKLYVVRAANTSAISTSTTINATSSGANVTLTGNASQISALGLSVGSIMTAGNTDLTIASVDGANITLTSVIVASSSSLFANGDTVNFLVNTATYSAIANVGIVTGLSSHTVRKPDDYTTASASFSANVMYIAKYPGVLGNSLKISVCDSNTAYNSSITINNADANLAAGSITASVGNSTLRIAVSNTSSGTLGEANTQANTVLNLLTVGDFIEVGNSTIGTQKMKISSLPTSPSSNASHRFIDVTCDAVYQLSTNYSSNTVTRYWEYHNLVDRAPGQSAYQFNYGNTSARDELHVVVADQDGLISGSPGTILEVFEAVSRSTDSKNEDGSTNYYKTVINDQSGYVYFGSTRSGLSETVATGLSSSSKTTPMTLSFYHGLDGSDESLVTPGILSKGYDLFKSAEDVDISLVLTGKSLGGTANTQTANYLIDNIAETRKDCVVFVSPQKSDVVNNIGNEATSINTFRNALRSTSYAVLDSGYKYQYDKYNDIYRWIPLNGDIAGLCVRTDDQRDPWFSPAGYNRGQIKNIIKLAYNPSKADRDVLYKNGVNPVVTFPGQGTILFGDKTLLAKPSAFDRINVRRLFIVLEKAIATAAKFTLFEFNDDFTRAQFRNLVEPFLRDVQGRRGIYDFKVVCDGTNNTGEVIDRNEFVGDIYIKPAKSINFIQLNFVAVRTGVEFSEVVGQF